MEESIFKLGDCATIRRKKPKTPPFPAIGGEQWKLVSVEPQKRYFVSDLGRFKSASKHGVEKLLQPYWKSGGRGKARRFCVHPGRNSPDTDLYLLVAKAFVPNPFKSNRITFRDGNKENCAADNLVWGRAVSREDQIAAFSATDGIKREHPEIVDNVVKYVLTRDNQFLGLAWQKAMRLYRKTVVSRLFKVSGFKHYPQECLVSDVVQEGLYRAQLAIETGRLRNPQNIEAWIGRIMSNTAITYGKQNHHISSEMDNADGEMFFLADVMGGNADFAYTPAWGVA